MRYIALQQPPSAQLLSQYSHEVMSITRSKLTQVPSDESPCVDDLPDFVIDQEICFGENDSTRSISRSSSISSSCNMMSEASSTFSEPKAFTLRTVKHSTSGPKRTVFANQLLIRCSFEDSQRIRELLLDDCGSICRKIEDFQLKRRQSEQHLYESDDDDDLEDE